MDFTLFERVRRRKGILLAVVLALAGTWAAVSGPRGLRVLLEKREEIRHLQEENAALEAENTRRRERVHRLEENHSEQELEIRKQLKLQRENETTIILPEKSAEPDKAGKGPGK